MWNHAWGYWYVYSQLSAGSFPLYTELVGAPEGGSLYFIDTPGAIIAYPITALFGPAVGYNFILLLRVTLAGLGAQLLCEELWKKTPASYVAGAAYASTPFLLCELSNGISEVCAVQWIPLTLWSIARALRRNWWRDWMLVGFFQACTSIATFYYGLATALLLVVLVILTLLRYLLAGRPITKLFFQSGFAGLFSALIFLPHGLMFWESIHREDRLVRRDTSLNEQLLRHNAVDPQVYFTPGTYQSVDLQQEYGEPFLHTGYLRWTVILLAILVLFRIPKLHKWGVLAVFSLLMGLGSYLWIDGSWYLHNAQAISLPFDWLRQVLPQIAITHPLRLSIGGQAIMCAIAGIGAAKILAKAPEKARGFVLCTMLIAVCAESLFASLAIWPIPTSPAEVPAVYQKADERGVLDLPAEVGTSMKTSQYFWMQTLHQSPIPYSPDIRVGSARDKETFSSFIGTDGISEQPRTPREKIIRHMKETYGLIVLHPELDSDLSAAYIEALSPAFGQPELVDGLYYWQLETVNTIEERQQQKQLTPPKLAQTTTNTDNKRSTANDKKVNCDDLGYTFSRLHGLQTKQRNETKAQLQSCGEKLSRFCIHWSKNKNISHHEVEICVQALRRTAVSGDIDTLIAFLGRQESSVRKAVIAILQNKSLTQPQKAKIMEAAAAETIPSISNELKRLGGK